MSATQIFVNLPVADIDRAKAFYTSLGFSLNPRWVYQRSFADPDGHHWEVVHVDEAAMAEAFASADAPS
jgi:predicted lactoylglutathione lyase